jgi:hypothetical protein
VFTSRDRETGAVGVEWNAFPICDPAKCAQFSAACGAATATTFRHTGYEEPAA